MPDYRSRPELLKKNTCLAQLPIKAASTSEAHKRQHYARTGDVSYDERSHKPSTLAVESFGHLWIENSIFIDQLATSVKGERDGESMARKGVVKERMPVSYTHLTLPTKA